MSWEVRYAGQAQRDLRRLDGQIAKRVLAAVERFALTGGGDVTRLQGPRLQWRLRVGDYRVRLTFIPEERSLVVLRVLHRSIAYRDL